MRAASHQDREPPDLRRKLAMGLILLLLFGLTALLLSLGERAAPTALIHLFLGWAFFLHRNLLNLTIDPDVIISLTAGTLLSMLLLHSSLRWWFRSIGQRWPLRASVVVIVFVFILFATSFIIPGVLTMLRSPLPLGVLSRSPSMHEHLVHANNLRHLGLCLMEYEHEQERPIVISSELDAVLADSGLDGVGSFRSGFEASGYLFLAAGLRAWDSSEIVPVLASPEYRLRGEMVRRVVNSQLEVRTLDLEEFENLLGTIPELHQGMER